MLLYNYRTVLISDVSFFRETAYLDGTKLSNVEHNRKKCTLLVRDDLVRFYLAENINTNQQSPVQSLPENLPE